MAEVAVKSYIFRFIKLNFENSCKLQEFSKFNFQKGKKYYFTATSATY